MTGGFWALLAAVAVILYVVGRRDGVSDERSKGVEARADIEADRADNLSDDLREVLDDVDSQALGSRLRRRLADRRAAIKRRRGSDDSDPDTDSG